MNALPAESLLEDRLAIVGTSGSGKTYTAGVLLEKILHGKNRVITQVAIIYQQPALSCSRQERNLFRRIRKWMACGRIGERPTMNRNINGYVPESFQ